MKTLWGKLAQEKGSLTTDLDDVLVGVGGQVEDVVPLLFSTL
jgi:hypothetical protein